ncbi:MAG TPA: metalloregulator ArsR/SmtB family transcription factor [Anaerolineaceae bacterium]|nr:metalloregulator ArsR/SmtB family transcription factor [Anaerolineaceae bacterium]HQC64177.1 metalloregulator ArsR/SmtB family transcription factor [Anaerolineaceae bacterium]
MKQNDLPLSENETHRKRLEAKAEILKALANPVRLCLMEQIIKRDETTVSELVTCMGASQSLISQYLGRLRSLGFVESRKSGNLVYYSCKNKAVRDLVEYILESNI